MNRRRFLSILAGAGAASATSYFFAPIGGWKSDVIAQPSMGLMKYGPEAMPRGGYHAGYIYGIPYWVVPQNINYLGIRRIEA